MEKLSDYIRLGISPSMLFPAAFDDELEHFCSIDRCCRLSEYESLETFLPFEERLRAEEIKKIKEYGKLLNYNTPARFQTEGAWNASSDDPDERAHAFKAMKQQIDFAAEAECPMIVLTGTPDKGPARRPVLLERYGEFFMKCAMYASTYHMLTVIEPIERGSFKNLILGPTKECAAFIKSMQDQGADNARLMLDTAHLPLMGEELKEAVQASIEAGLIHIHMGNAVLDKTSGFYGHTHPPVGVQKGCFDCEELTMQFKILIQTGYIPTVPGGRRASISLETRPYPGVSGELSARIMYEKISYAFMTALKELRGV
ncbi:TIM barrel protein [Lachnospiraceae bacterium 62-35]